MIKCLGLSFGHDGSAAVVINKKLVSYVQTERITRVKKDRGVTKEVIDYVLNKADLKLDQIDIVAITNWYWDKDVNGKELFDKEKKGFSITNQNGTIYPEQEYAKFFASSGGLIANGIYTFNVGEQSLPCIFIDHHFAHNCSSFYMSDFESSICLSLDFSDNLGTSNALYYFDKDRHHAIKKNDLILGSFYGQICDYLGFYPSLTDAGKVMALAAYGKHDQDVVNKLSYPDINNSFFKGDYYLGLLYNSGVNKLPERRVFYPQLNGEGGEADEYWLNKIDWDKERNKNIAANAQKILEDSLLNYLEEIIDNIKISDNFCFSGGTMLNCVANGRIKERLSSLGKNVFIPPCPGDDGLSIGAAFFASNNIMKKNKALTSGSKGERHIHSIKDKIEGGVKYSDIEIESALNNNKDKIVFDKYEYSEVVEELKNNKVIGWFADGSEIGPRALCRRSIIADPRNKKIKDILNKNVKHRESFRPFAPVVLKSEVSEWFDAPDDDNPFMLFSHKCKQPKKIPGICHVDDSARIQTIEDDCRFYSLLSEFNKDTSIPVLINTSFNVKGEPIVESPEDAIKCFLGTNIDVLIIEDYIVRKV